MLFLILLSCFYNFSYSQAISIKEFLKLNIHIIDVKPEVNKLTINGYDKDGKVVIKEVLFERNEVLAVGRTTIYPTISIVTIPTKIRPAIDTFSNTASFGLTNAGLNIGLLNRKLERYFINGKKSLHNFSLGVIIAPSVEELSGETSRNFLNKKTKQLFISTGISLSYTFNDISISFIPAGWDYATTNDGKKYVYNKRRWWGFGIGISTKLLGL